MKAAESTRTDELAFTVMHALNEQEEGTVMLQCSITVTRLDNLNNIICQTKLNPPPCPLPPRHGTYRKKEDVFVDEWPVKRVQIFYSNNTFQNCHNGLAAKSNAFPKSLQQSGCHC